MRIVIAPDSFKESLAAAEVAAAIESGLRELWPDAEYLRVPMADGGEGTAAAVLAALGGRTVPVRVTGPMGDPVDATFALIDHDAQRLAILEIAAASGLPLVPEPQRNPMRATSFGAGELLRAALDHTPARIVLGLGGSATVDAGAGLLQALGAQLLDAQGRQVPRGGAGLAQLQRIDLAGLDPRLRACRLEAACDVDNPLLGEHGAARVFGPQKGAPPAMVAELESGLANFAAVVQRDLGADIAHIPGAGAAGGAGAGLLACLNTRLRPGAELVAELTGLEDAIRGADLVFTGEGRIDGQTARGKTPIGVATVARRHGVPVVALAGSLGEGWRAVLGCGIDAAFSIVPGPCTRDEAYAATAANLQAAGRGVAALLRRRTS